MLGLGRDILRLVSTGVTGGGGGPDPGYTPPLDAYPNTVVAYSVRKLSSTYTGPCMQIRRASDGATQDIGFDGNGLVHTSDIISFCSGSVGTVSVWYDQGSLSQDATQSNPTKQPEFYSGTDFYYLGEYPYVRATSSQEFTFSLSHTGDWTNLTIIASTLTSNTGWTYGVGGGAGRGAINAGNGAVDLYYGAVSSIAGDSLAQNLYSLFVDNTGIDWFRNGLGNTGVGGGLSGFSWDTFMSRRASDSSRMAMQEWITWSSDLISNKQTLESNLNSYYQVTNLPDYTSGFLADYPDAAAAYSVRKLSNTAIKCMRVRRAVAPFDEKDIGFTAGGDLDEAAIVAFGGSDVLTVSAWYDQSGQSRHAIQINPNSQPQIYNGTAVITENGKPALDCDGNGADHFTLTTGLGDVTLYTILAVLEDGIRNPVSGEGSMLFADGTSDWIWYNNVSTVNVDATGSSKNISTTWSTSQRLDYHSLVSGTAYFGSDGATLDSVTGVTGGVPINYLLGHYGTLGNYNYNGKAQEIIIWESDQDAAGNRTAIETNINDYYTVSPNGDAPTSGFLFDYSGATFAYSIRQLNDNADYCMQVIRADGVTLSIGFDGSGYVDTAAIVSFAAGQKVYLNRMYDQTGNRYHSGTVSALPGVRLVVVYDGTNLITKNGQLMPQMDLLSSASSSSMVSPTGTALGVTHSLYAVVQRPSTPSALNMFSSNAGVTALYQERSGNLTYGPGWTSFGIYTYPTVSNEPRLYSYIRKNGTDGECFNDGVSQGTTTAMTAATSVNISGYRFDKTQTGIQADCSGFQEMIAYTADRTAVGDNANILANIKAYYPSIP